MGLILTISTTHRPATDLGYLLHKNPAKAQTFGLSFGRAHAFYPEADEARCTFALMLEIDPVGLVRRRDGGLEQYVNDRPYAASSHLSVAMSRVLGSALGGRSKERPELTGARLPLRARIAALPCRRGGEETLRRLFEPLGYRVEAEGRALDAAFPEWGASPYMNVELSAETTLRELLAHLYVLIPVLDNGKHYWVGDEEVEKLLRVGEGWLGGHPEREMITRRYLEDRARLTRDALAQLVEDAGDPDEAESAHAAEEEAAERPLSLNEQRLGSVMAALKASGARRVLDLGCGEGNLLREMMREKSLEEIVGMDVSVRALEIASSRLRLEELDGKRRERIRLIHGSLMYRDARLEGFDAAAVVEVIEHLDAARLEAMERVVFECARPSTVIVTTPNVEYNVKWETLPAGRGGDGGEAAGVRGAREEGDLAAGGEMPRGGVSEDYLRAGVHGAGEPVAAAAARAGAQAFAGAAGVCAGCGVVGAVRAEGAAEDRA